MRVPGTIKEIRARLLKEEPSESFIRQLQNDPRAGVRQLAQTYLRADESTRQEEKRIAAMWQFEQTYREQGYQVIAGVDEAGRGPLAGPVVAAAVILPEDFDASGLKDSKELSAKERLQLRTRIEKEAQAVAIDIVDAAYIDQHNILQATYQAMRNAVRKLSIKPDFLLVDAVSIPDMDIPQHGIVKGDRLSHSIAAASIIAKTVRDEWMLEAAKQYPEYGFEKHKGYATLEHQEALAKWGPCPIHRRSFAPVQEWGLARVQK